MKPHLIYYVATSLDGFIARPDGSVDWLDRFAEGGNDHGYNGFYQGIDGLLMGRGTYDIVRGFGDWPYPGKPLPGAHPQSPGERGGRRRVAP